MLVDGLKANLISISQLCDDGLQVNFNKTECCVFDRDNIQILCGKRSCDNCYLLTVKANCLHVKIEETEIWHQKLGHTSFRNLQKLISTQAITGIPRLKFHDKRLCDASQVGKQVKTSHPKVQDISTTSVLELLHMDLMGPIQTESIGKKKYIFVCVDDFSRFTWVDFIKEKSEAFAVFRKLCLKLQQEKRHNVCRIRSDHGKEFDNGSSVKKKESIRSFQHL